MEKQIMINHLNGETTTRIKTIISYLGLIVDSNDKIAFNFCLNFNQLKIFEEIKYLEQDCNIKIVKIEINQNNKKNYDIDVVIYFKDIKYILNVIEKYELNVIIVYNEIKVFLNDNDGDFIIINSSHEKYKAIKNIKI